MEDNKLRKRLYIVYLTIVIVLATIIFTSNTISNMFTYALLGILLIVSSIFGLLSKAVFLGRAIVFPYKSNSILTIIANILIGAAGISFIIVNIIILCS